MKKSTMLIGNLAIFALLVGAIFKAQYFQLADILIAFACLLFSFGYTVPLYFEKCKVIHDPHSKMIAFWIMLLMVVFPIAFMFKILYFPYADELVWVIFGIVVLSIPFFVYHGVKKKEPLNMMNFQNEMYISIFLVSCLIILFATNKKESDEYLLVNRHELNEIKFHNNKSDELFAVIQNTISQKGFGEELLKNAKEAKGSSDSLFDYITSLQKMMVEKAGQKDWNPDSVELLEYKGDCSSPRAVFLDNGGPKKGAELKLKVKNYKEMMLAITSVRGKDVIAQFFNLENVNSMSDGKKIGKSWESFMFEGRSLVYVVTSLNQLKSNIRLLEAETMIFIQAKTAKANFENAPCGSSCDYLYGCFM